MICKASAYVLPLGWCLWSTGLCHAFKDNIQKACPVIAGQGTWTLGYNCCYCCSGCYAPGQFLPAQCDPSVLDGPSSPAAVVCDRTLASIAPSLACCYSNMIIFCEFQIFPKLKEHSYQKQKGLTRVLIGIVTLTERSKTRFSEVVHKGSWGSA